MGDDEACVERRAAGAPVGGEACRHSGGATARPRVTAATVMAGHIASPRRASVA